MEKVHASMVWPTLGSRTAKRTEQNLSLFTVSCPSPRRIIWYEPMTVTSCGRVGNRKLGIGLPC